VDYESKTATVAFDPEIASVSDLTAATTRAGYPSKPKE
jgi:copper chaperone CopZ